MERCSMAGEEDLDVLLKGCRLSCRDMASITVDGTFTVQRNTNNCRVDQSVFCTNYCLLLSSYCINCQHQIQHDKHDIEQNKQQFHIKLYIKEGRSSYLMLRHYHFPHSFVVQHAVHTKITLPNCKMRRAWAFFYLIKLMYPVKM